MGTHPIFESDFDCLTERVMEDPTMMTEEEREIFFNRDETLLERIGIFRTESKFKYAEQCVKGGIGKVSSLNEGIFNKAPIFFVYLIWQVFYSERFSAIKS